MVATWTEADPSGARFWTLRYRCHGEHSFFLFLMLWTFQPHNNKYICYQQQIKKRSRHTGLQWMDHHKTNVVSTAPISLYGRNNWLVMGGWCRLSHSCQTNLNTSRISAKIIIKWSCSVVCVFAILRIFGLTCCVLLYSLG